MFRKYGSVFLIGGLVLILGAVWFGINYLPQETIHKEVGRCSFQQAKKEIVRGTSMAPLLKPNQEIIALYGYYKKCPVKRGDIVLYQHPGRQEPIVKFVKSVPGDVFALREDPGAGGWHLYINGKLVRNSEGVPYLFSKQRVAVLKLYEKHHNPLPENTYLLLGNRVAGSLDSTLFGLVDKNSILAKVVIEHDKEKTSLSEEGFD